MTEMSLLKQVIGENEFVYCVDGDLSGEESDEIRGMRYT